jgi:hypothetical protein
VLRRLREARSRTSLRRYRRGSECVRGLRVCGFGQRGRGRRGDIYPCRGEGRNGARPLSRRRGISVPQPRDRRLTGTPTAPINRGPSAVFTHTPQPGMPPSRRCRDRFRAALRLPGRTDRTSAISAYPRAHPSRDLLRRSFLQESRNDGATIALTVRGINETGMKSR